MFAKHVRELLDCESQRNLTMPSTISLIVACAENRVIGRDGQLPWRIPEDWDFFRRQTTGATVILGRISFYAWKSILHDDRRAIVVTHEKETPSERVSFVPSLDAAITEAKQDSTREIYICGGEAIFAEAIKRPDVTRLYLTLVHATVPGDRFFPPWEKEFPTVLQRRGSADQNFRYTFYTLGR
jgi:dihydrofolate reductase